MSTKACSGLTDPSAIQVDGNERGRNREVIDEGVQLEHEPKLITGCHKLQKKKSEISFLVYFIPLSHGAQSQVAHPNREIDHEENVEGEINLLSCILGPPLTLFYGISVIMNKSLITWSLLFA